MLRVCLARFSFVSSQLVTTSARCIGCFSPGSLKEAELFEKDEESVAQQTVHQPYFLIRFSIRTSRRTAHLDSCSTWFCLLSRSINTIFHFAWDCLSTGQLGHALKAEVFRLARTIYCFASLSASDCHHMVSLSVCIYLTF